MLRLTWTKIYKYFRSIFFIVS